MKHTGYETEQINVQILSLIISITLILRQEREMFEAVYSWISIHLLHRSTLYSSKQGVHDLCACISVYIDWMRFTCVYVCCMSLGWLNQPSICEYLSLACGGLSLFVARNAPFLLVRDKVIGFLVVMCAHRDVWCLQLYAQAQKQTRLWRSSRLEQYSKNDCCCCGMRCGCILCSCRLFTKTIWDTSRVWLAQTLRCDTIFQRLHIRPIELWLLVYMILTLHYRFGVRHCVERFA